LYSEEPQRLSFSPVSAQNVKHILLHSSRSAAPLGFCYGGFSSTAGYVSGNEAYAFYGISGFAPFGGSFPKGVARFYPNDSKNPKIFLSKPFGFGSGRQ
jgi:hypothetical protein